MRSQFRICSLWRRGVWKSSHMRVPLADRTIWTIQMSHQSLAHLVTSLLPENRRDFFVTCRNMIKFFLYRKTINLIQIFVIKLWFGIKSFCSLKVQIRKCLFFWRILHSSQSLSITSVLFSLNFRILLFSIFIELLKIIYVRPARWVRQYLQKRRSPLIGWHL